MPEDLLTIFNFEVCIAPSGLEGDEGLSQGARGSFSEVSGLEINLEKKEIREGGYNRGARQLIGKTSHPELVFKRGLTLDRAFWDWIQSCTSGKFPLPYVAGSIRVYSARGKEDFSTHARWKFRQGIAVKVRTADLNAASANSVPIEELHIAHEGLERVPRDGEQPATENRER
jgi:phage tail-like protein